MTDLCARANAAIEERASGAGFPPELAAHLESCARCQASLALAARIDRVLAAWPEAAVPADFAAAVSARARQELWRQDVVIDWGFNLALAMSLGLIVAGAASFLWLLGAMADPVAASRLAAGSLETMLRQTRGQSLVVTTAAALLVTTAGAWWWAEERRRW